MTDLKKAQSQALEQKTNALEVLDSLYQSKSWTPCEFCSHGYRSMGTMQKIALLDYCANCVVTHAKEQK